LHMAELPETPPENAADWRPPSSQIALPNLNEKFDQGVSMLAWGYNEELLVHDFLKRAIACLDAAASDWEIVFVDDCSTDRTASIVQALAEQDNRIKLVQHDRNQNVGIACRTAVKHASKDVLFWQTVDWSYDIHQLRIFLELTRHFDVVQGIRPVPIRLLSYIPILRSIYRVKRRSDNMSKAIISLSNYYLLRILFGVHFHDFQNVTFYPTSLAQSLDMTGRTSFVNPEFLLKSFYTGASFIEVPIRFIPRKQGVAKGTRPKTVIRSVVDTFRNWLAWGALARIQSRNKNGTIKRIAEPFSIDETVLRLVVPLFRDFR
jgi:glycosyltransferase involved in cell wall biosynthesis